MLQDQILGDEGDEPPTSPNITYYYTILEVMANMDDEEEGTFITYGDVVNWMCSIVADPQKIYSEMEGHMPDYFNTLLFPFTDIMWEFQAVNEHEEVPETGSDMLYAGDLTKYVTVFNVIARRALLINR